MSRKYRAGHTPKHRGRKIVIVMIPVMVILAGLGGIVAWDVLKNQDTVAVSGPTNSVAQVLDSQSSRQPVTIDEQLYSLQLPADWKEVERRITDQEQSVGWQAKQKGEDNRWLKIYIDKIPSDLAVNRLLPVDPSGDTIAYRQLSDNCANFTNPGTNNKVPTASKWQQINFICDLPNFVQNKVGIGSIAGLNKVEITGTTKGKHAYFLVYTDHNVQPDYNILYNALKTFRAK